MLKLYYGGLGLTSRLVPPIPKRRGLWASLVGKLRA